MEVGNISSNSSGIMRRGRRSTRSLDYAIPYTAASGTFSFVGGVSNLFVMFILLKYVGLKQNTYVYMFSLFLSDFVYNCIVQPQVCYYEFPTSVITLFGMYYIHGAQMMCILTGSSSLFFASLDKYIFIKYPFFYGNHITKTITRVVVVCIWLACVGLGVMRFYNIVLVKDGYLAIIAILFVLTILVQIMTFVIARDQDERIQQLNRSLEHNHPRGEFGQNVVQPRANQSSNKAAKTIGLLLAVYIASWLPVNIYRVEYRWNGGNSTVYHKWVKIVNLMIQLHSCVNPWLFVARSKDMKIGTAKFVRRLGVHRFGGEQSDSSEMIVGSYGQNVTASSRAHNSKNLYESGDSLDGRNGSSGDVMGSGESGNVQEQNINDGKIGGHLNSSFTDGTDANNVSASSSSEFSSGNIDGQHVNSSYQNSSENVENVDEINARNFNASSSSQRKDKNIEGQDRNGENFTASADNLNGIGSHIQSQSGVINRDDETNYRVGKDNMLMDNDKTENENMENCERDEGKRSNVNGSNVRNIDKQDNDSIEERKVNSVKEGSGEYMDDEVNGNSKVYSEDKRNARD